eukprot:g27281.t1
MAFLFEILDATVHDEQLRLSPVAWGFLHLAAVQPSRRKLRIQLWSYRQRRNFCGRVALEENSDDIPLVESWFETASIRALASAMASLLGRRRQKCPAALEFTLDMSQKPNLGRHPMDQGEKIPDTRLEVVAPKITVEQGSPKAETVAEEEILGHLAPQHARPKSQACVLPEELLWQVPSGKRGASRMAISPQTLGSRGRVWSRLPARKAPAVLG